MLSTARLIKVSAVPSRSKIHSSISSNVAACTLTRIVFDSVRIWSHRMNNMEYLKVIPGSRGTNGDLEWRALTLLKGPFGHSHLFEAHIDRTCRNAVLEFLESINMNKKNSPYRCKIP